jgi:hypothetical protein
LSGFGSPLFPGGSGANYDQVVLFSQISLSKNSSKQIGL